jgi:SagB-type dehydrogenase family enzyme
MNSIEDFGIAFLEASKLKNLPLSPEKSGDAFPQYLDDVPQEKIITLPAADTIDLQQTDLRSVILNRRSLRKYSEENFTLSELSWLLWATQGVTKVSERSGMSLRNVPSAGMRHPMQTFLAVQKVEGLEPGLYMYVPQNHGLLLVNGTIEVLENVHHAAMDAGHAVNAAVSFIWAAIPYRTAWRYSTRAYRYLFLDAGHICQNLYLAAEGINCGVCAVGHYDDDLANQALGLDGKSEFVIYIATVGKRPVESQTG